jgi:3-methyladenine DNA glycosylase AlkD
VKAPAVRDVFRTLFAEFGALPVETLVDEAFLLLRSPYQEEKQLAVLLLERLRRRWPPALLSRLEPVFDEAVHDWATCDGIAGRVLMHLLGDPHASQRIAGWSRSRHPWRQRAAAVAFVKVARRGQHTATILGLCEPLSRTDDRFVQLGMGWVLRELFLADADVMLDFLRRHYSHMRREALRYAIEKMPAPLQATLLAEHKAATARSK